ncbi:MAG TPA: hypothetical protein DEP42_06080 [Ruminococcaceae bacterium]|nr:hypothetical protein [Oscillospiraceae bacterium]
MNIYIVEDDQTVIDILEDIIEEYHLGEICGDSGGKVPDEQEILSHNPDLILVDFLMPEKDGIQIVQNLREMNCHAKCIMVSQVSDKKLIGKAYHAGIDFFISKPINVIEVKTVIGNIIREIENEKTLSNIRNIFQKDTALSPARKEEKDNFSMRRYQYILNQLGMSGERGSEDILKMCEYLRENHVSLSQISLGQLFKTLTNTPQNMEQRVRRAIAAGMCNLAHLGIVFALNETFERYSGSLFPFEEIRAEMDFIRGKRERGGKINIKKFIDGLMILTEQG